GEVVGGEGERKVLHDILIVHAPAAAEDVVEQFAHEGKFVRVDGSRLTHGRWVGGKRCPEGMAFPGVLTVADERTWTRRPLLPEKPPACSQPGQEVSETPLYVAVPDASERNLAPPVRPCRRTALRGHPPCRLPRGWVNGRTSSRTAFTREREQPGE